MSRRKTRQILLQLLYAEEVSQTIHGEMPSCFNEITYQQKLHEKEKEFVQKYFVEIQKRQVALDQSIQKLSRQSGWNKERLSIIDKSILRLALYEIDHTDTDTGVAINEAVELAKRFGGEASSRFVNGILGAYARAKAG